MKIIYKNAIKFILNPFDKNTNDIFRKKSQWRNYLTTDFYFFLFSFSFHIQFSLAAHEIMDEIRKFCVQFCLDFYVVLIEMCRTLEIITGKTRYRDAFNRSENKRKDTIQRLW